MAARRVAKEQKFAEKQLATKGKTSKEIANLLVSNRNPISIDTILSAASKFDGSPENQEFIETLLNKPKQRVMYEFVKEHLQGDWLVDLNKISDVLSPGQSMNLQTISWEDWRAIADKAGLEEAGLKNVLQVIAVFRDGISKQNMAPKKLR